MHFLHLTLPDPAANLALDEALLLDAQTGGEVLRVWEWPAPVVVLGAACKIADDVNDDACRADGVPIHRRSTGGGTVLWGCGCLVYSLVLSYDRAPELTQIGSSYRYILGRVAAALGVDGVRPVGVSDLALGDRKFSGNAAAAQTVVPPAPRHAPLRLRPHGRWPLSPTAAATAGIPGAQSHEDFLCNLPLTPARIAQGLRTVWGADEARTTWPEETVRTLCAEKYRREAWTRRR